VSTPDNALPVRPAVDDHPWAPLREPLFRGLWIASLISFTGTWIQNVASGWFMASLTSSAIMVALVQAAMSLPVFLVAIPAGALADMLDRRRLLIFAQCWMMVVAFALATLAGLHLMGPSLLLALTFLLGLGAVINDPAWQAIAPDVVSPQRLPSGIALNSVGFNIARAVGPSLGGLIIAIAGVPAAFALNGLSFLGVIFFLRQWKPQRTNEPLPLSKLLHCIAEGWQHLQSSSQVKAVLIRTGLFTLFASALWALLPLIGKPFGPIGYGLMLASFGTGAFLSSWLLPTLRTRLGSTNALIAFASITFALALFALGETSQLVWLCAILFIAGGCWILMLASLNISAQYMSPAGVRARSLSFYLFMLQGGMAGGSAIWGLVASARGIREALSLSAVGLILGCATMFRFRLHPATPMAPPMGISAGTD
jgi:predicted MFS family arabinose efflux permease